MSKPNNLKELKIKAEKIFNNSYNYDNIEHYNSMNDDITIVCPKHGEFKNTWHWHINKKRGCKDCAIERVTDTKESFILKSQNTHGDKYDYSKVEYINSKTKVTIICKVHGEFTQKPCDHINSSQGCPKCKQSKGEIEISKYLIENVIEYVYQKTFDGCRYKLPLHFDFYLSDYNICVEFDGEQHFKIVEGWGGEEGFIGRQMKDKIKTAYCKDNNIKLVRIKYTDDIINKLKEIC